MYLRKSESKSHSVVSNSLRPWTIHGILSMEFSRPEYWSGQPFPFPGDLPHPGIESRSPALQVDSLPAEPQEKPKNTGVATLSLLQWIFPTQESNWGLLHCSQILYQLSYQGSHIYAWLQFIISYRCLKCKSKITHYLYVRLDFFWRYRLQSFPTKKGKERRKCKELNKLQ